MYLILMSIWKKMITTFKHLSSEQTKGVRSKFELKQVFDELFILFRLEMQRKKISYDIKCTSDIIMTSYRATFIKIFSCLISNSLKHGFVKSNGGHILIDVKEKKSDTVITFSDDGVGISEEHLRKIFDPFYSIKRDKESPGLGLNIVYNAVVHFFNGSIDCISKKGEGVTFHIVIPKEIDKI